MSSKSQKKRGNSNNPLDKEEVISQLIDRFNLYVIVFIIIGVFCGLVPFIIHSMNIQKISENPIFLVLFPVFLSLVAVGIGSESTKSSITGKLNKFEEKFFKIISELSQEKEDLNGQNNNLNQQIEDLQKNKDANIIKDERLRYLADIYMANENTSNREKIIYLVLQEYSNKFPNGSEQIKTGLTTSFKDYQNRRNLRAVITNIKKQSWKRLATAAASKAFKIKQADVGQLNDEYEKYLFVDIYIYLCAWLVNSIEVNSIDNNIPTSMRYMPVKEIGLNYHDKEQKFKFENDFEAYETALSELIRIFDLGSFARLFDDIQELSPEQIEICQKGVSPYLIVLMKMLKDFFEKRAAEERTRTSAGDNP